MRLAHSLWLVRYLSTGTRSIQDIQAAAGVSRRTAVRWIAALRDAINSGHWTEFTPAESPCKRYGIYPPGKLGWIATHVRPEPSEHPGPTPKRRKRSGAPPAAKLPFPPRDRS